MIGGEPEKSGLRLSSIPIVPPFSRLLTKYYIYDSI